MPVFEYLALDRSGNEVPGNVDAVDVHSAVAKLREQERGGVEAQRGSGLRRTWNRIRPVTQRDVILFFEHLSLMLRSGLTVIAALHVCRDQTVKGRLALALDRVATAVRSGSRFSESLAGEPQLFNDSIIRMIEAAETSGELDQTLHRIAQKLKRAKELKSKMVNSLVYPLLVILLAGGVFFFLVTRIIPRFAMFFERRQKALPPSTQMLMDISNFINNYGLMIGFGIFAALIALALFYRTSRGRLIGDRTLLGIPVVGQIFVTAAMAHVGHSLAMLLRSGVPLLQSLSVTGRGVYNRAISLQIDEAAKGVLDGRTLSSGLRGGAVPPIVTQVIAVGERTGALDQVLDEMSIFYEQQLQEQLLRMNALFEPAVTVVLGGIVGFVYYAFFQAVFQLVK
jgi:type II secretory pathway component PulF